MAVRYPVESVTRDQPSSHLKAGIWRLDRETEVRFQSMYSVRGTEYYVQVYVHPWQCPGDKMAFVKAGNSTTNLIPHIAYKPLLSPRLTSFASHPINPTNQPHIRVSVSFSI